MPVAAGFVLTQEENNQFTEGAGTLVLVLTM